MLHEAPLDVIICTCTVAASVLQYTDNIKQLIVDDCTETDTIIPFTCNPEQMILIGDSVIASDLKTSDSVIATALSKCLDNASYLSMQFDMVGTIYDIALNKVLNPPSPQLTCTR